jgi:hypothetical protein
MADHWRSARSDVGGFDHPSGLYDGSYAPSNLIPFPSGTPLELREIREPPSHESELKLGRLFLAGLLAQALFILLLVVGYQAFVP